MIRLFIRVLPIIFIVCHTTSTRAEILSGNDKRVLASDSTYTSVTFEVESSQGVIDESQPPSLGIGNIIFGAGEGAYEIEYLYSEAPEYRSMTDPGYGKGDFDAQDRLLYWRPVEMKAYFTKTGGKKITTFELYRISKNGVPEKISRSSDFGILGPGQTDFFTTTVVLAMGVGFSGRLSGSVSPVSTADTDGLVFRQNDNARFGPAKGRWDVELELRNGLAREAAFQLSTSGLDTTIVSTSGTVEKHGVQIAKHGVVKHSANDHGTRFRFKGIEQDLKYKSTISTIKNGVEMEAEIQAARK